MDDWINAKRPQKISAIGPGTSTSDIPKLLKAALNLPMDVIDGYKGGADARLAVESGEVDGYCGSWGTVETVWRSAYESKKIHPCLAGVAQVASEVQEVFRWRSITPRPKKRASCSASPTAPTARSFPSPCRRAWPRIGSSCCRGLSFDTLKDPDLIAEAKKSQLDIEPVDGPTIAKKLAQSLRSQAGHGGATERDLAAEKESLLADSESATAVMRAAS